jgi:hypothetical protein
MSARSGNILLDFRTLFESAPGSFVVLTPDLRIVAATDVYLKATMTRREDIVGRELFEVFVENPDDPQAGRVVEQLRRSFERVLRHRTAEALPVHRYDIRRRSEDGWVFEERYWSPVSAPVLGPGAQVLISHAAEDVTDFVRLKQLDTEWLEVRPGARHHENFDPPGAERAIRLADVTRHHVVEAFRATCENVTRTARTLGISRVALRRRLREYGVLPQRHG